MPYDHVKNTHSKYMRFLTLMTVLILVQGYLFSLQAAEAPAAGWQKIRGKFYFYDESAGCFLTNTIAGRGKNRFYVDQTGVRVTDPVIRQAVAFVRDHTKGKKTRKGKLKACYRYIVDVCRYRAFDDPESIGKMPSYASCMFRTQAGNCYRGAAALTYAAKVLGYETRMGIGGVTAYENHALSTHGWTEVKIGKKWYICDTSMQRYHQEDDLFLVPRDKYPYRLRIDKVYRLTVKNGKVRWK